MGDKTQLALKWLTHRYIKYLHIFHQYTMYIWCWLALCLGSIHYASVLSTYTSMFRAARCHTLTHKCYYCSYSLLEPGGNLDCNGTIYNVICYLKKTQSIYTSLARSIDTLSRRQLTYIINTVFQNVQCCIRLWYYINWLLVFICYTHIVIIKELWSFDMFSMLFLLGFFIWQTFWSQPGYYNMIQLLNT